MNLIKPQICIYHAPCQDGFTAAWAIWKRWPDVEFIPGVYGQDPPENLVGKCVLLVDFTYKRPVLEKMAEQAYCITILDHHKSAQEDLAPFIRPVLGFDYWELDEGGQEVRLPRIQACFDMNKSGAMMAWEYANPDLAAPELVKHVQDRDLWWFALEGTRQIAATLSSHPYDFNVWDRLAVECQSEVARAQLIAEGQAIERKHHKDIAELLAICTRTMVIGGHRVPVANLPRTLSSDGAGKLAEGQPFGACYYENSEGKRVFSLRVRDGGVDVSAIAVAYGGGRNVDAAITDAQ